MKSLTKYRGKILSSLQERKDHPTAKMVYDSLKSEDSKISFATVYNSLEFLVSNGYVKKLDLDCDSARFDALLENHSHLVCNRCGEVIDVPAMAVPESDFLQRFDFTPEEISITIRGICRHCRSN